MKWIFVLAAAAVLTGIFGLPFREYDAAKLLPIQTLQVDVQGRKVVLLSEAGGGEGESFLQAVEDLQKNASGDVFFDTAEHLLLCDAALLPQILESELLRPAAQVYFTSGLRETQGLSEYLSAHPSGLTLSLLRARGLGGA